MSDEAAAATRVEPVPGLLRLTHLIYGLHALSVLMGLLSFGFGGAAIRFVIGLPSIVAVLINYARRAEARGTWLESHFRWQIHTFWFALLWIAITLVVSWPFVLFLVGIFMAMFGFGVVGIWVIYRVARGWLLLSEHRPAPLVF
ncbi:MAG: hypothetical protein ABSE43_07470 [Steroidobacteraceae bacterium]|jgi:uncharacterized membrane protein